MISDSVCMYIVSISMLNSTPIRPSDHEFRSAWLGPSLPLDLSTLPLRSDEIPLQYPSLRMFLQPHALPFVSPDSYHLYRTWLLFSDDSVELGWQTKTGRKCRKPTEEWERSCSSSFGLNHLLPSRMPSLPGFSMADLANWIKYSNNVAAFVGSTGNQLVCLSNGGILTAGDAVMVPWWRWRR